MSSAESLTSPGNEPERPRLPLTDINLSPVHRRTLQAELASLFNNERAVTEILRLTTYPRANIPSFADSNAMQVWGDILFQLDNGIIRAGYHQILNAALSPYPYNQVLRPLAEQYGVREPEPGEGTAQAPPATGATTSGPATAATAATTGTTGTGTTGTGSAGTGSAGTPGAAAAPEQPEQGGARDDASARTCHVIIRASTADDRVQAAKVLRQLGLEPAENWSTAHAVSYRVNSAEPEHVRSRLQQTRLGWTVVAPGLPDYLLHTLYIEGPDGRNFRITDAPAQQIVGNVAAEVLDQYGDEFPDATQSAVVDHVQPGGAGRRLDPSATLDESGVRDGDRLRVGFQARAAAVNPVDHQEALYGVRNQILEFAEAQAPELEFAVRANSTTLPTEYVLGFRMPSFGPPPSAEGPPAEVGRHQVLIQLGPEFPEVAPLVFWLTPIFHPNVFPNYECEVSRGREEQMGLVCLGTLQKAWVPGLNFGRLCQMLVDIAGFRNYSLYQPDGMLNAAGERGRRVDFFDPYAAAWAESPDGVRRIGAISGSPLRGTPLDRPEYHNVIEKIGADAE